MIFSIDNLQTLFSSLMFRGTHFNSQFTSFQLLIFINIDALSNGSIAEPYSQKRSLISNHYKFRQAIS